MSILDDIVSVLDDVWDAITSLFSSKPAASPVQPCQDTALTTEQAQAWFDHFKGDKSIPWDYPNDCCYNRAHVMAQELKAAGVPVGKVWNYAPDSVGSGPLRVATPNDPNGYVTWGYHVAPTVQVQQPDGTVRDMVIDPSISDRPLTPEAWKALQGQPTSNLVLTSSEPYYRDESGRVAPTPTDQQVADIFEEHRRARALNWAGRTGP